MILFVLVFAGFGGVGIYTLFTPFFGNELSFITGAIYALVIFYLLVKPLLTVPPCTSCGESSTKKDSQKVIRCAGCGSARYDLN